ncbi:MAG: hypothetical protein WCT12_06275 [Verrucomicrobiota bacterium]
MTSRLLEPELLQPDTIRQARAFALEDSGLLAAHPPGAAALAALATQARQDLKGGPELAGILGARAALALAPLDVAMGPPILQVWVLQAGADGRDWEAPEISPSAGFNHRKTIRLKHHELFPFV